MTRRAARHLNHPRTGPRGLERFVKTRQRFDQNAAPATLFQEPRLRTVVRIVRSNFDKKAVGIATEKLPNEFAFAGGRIHLDCRYWSSPRAQRTLRVRIVSSRRARLPATWSRGELG